MTALGNAQPKGLCTGRQVEWPRGHCSGTLGSSRCAAAARPRPPHAATAADSGRSSITSSHTTRTLAAGWTGSCRGRTLVARSSSAVETLGRQLTAEEEAVWKASCDSLGSALGLSPDECNRLLARAFGWTTQAFWRREKIEELPRPEQVVGAVAVLREDLGLSGEEAARLVAVFPEVLACDVEGRLRANIARLESQWRLKGSTLTKAVLRQPAVLGYSVDCGGDCVGECNRCWARF